MAHFDVIPWFIKIGLRRFDNDTKKATEYTYNKIEKDWNKKLTLPEAKELVREKYEAIKIVLESIIEN